MVIIFGFDEIELLIWCWLQLNRSDICKGKTYLIKVEGILTRLENFGEGIQYLKELFSLYTLYIRGNNHPERGYELVLTVAFNCKGTDNVLCNRPYYDYAPIKMVFGGMKPSFINVGDTFYSKHLHDKWVSNTITSPVPTKAIKEKKVDVQKKGTVTHNRFAALSK